MRQTLHLRAQAREDVSAAAEILRRGGLVAFATETVYGLGADARRSDAVQAIFAAKGRPSWDPLIVHVPSVEEVELVARVEGPLRRRVEVLAEAFWPGPLTMLLPRDGGVPDAVTAGRSLVGVRVPAHPAAQALLRAAGLPLAAPSANRFGHTSPTSAEHVLADLGGRIDAVLDAGACAVGVESTVLDPAPTPMVVYRFGAVTIESIAAASGVPVLPYVPPGGAEVPSALPSPGVGIRHYAPECEVRLSGPSPEALWAAVRDALQQRRRTGVLLPADWPRESSAALVQTWGRWTDPAALAAGLFAGLRTLESAGVEVMVCPLPEAGGMGDALRDRLLKAAKPR